MLIVEDGSACSEEIDFVELRCATVPAFAGMTLVEKAYAGMTALMRAMQDDKR